MWCSGAEGTPDDNDDAQAVASGRGAGISVVAEAGAEDPEHPASLRGAGMSKLQRALLRLSDTCVDQGLVARAQRCGDSDTLLRLRELSSPL